MEKLPILVLAFNRKESVVKALKAIRDYQPERLYLSCDGARDNKVGEKDIVTETRKAMLNMIDWPCKIMTLFQEKNLGCAHAVYDAITWFFNNEKYGIIIEDDIVISQDFFHLCEILLPMYEKDEHIMQISAQNRSFKIESSDEYVFNRMPIIWGWATWKRAWEKMDMQMSQWPHYPKLKILKAYGIFQGCMMWYYWDKTFKNLKTNQSWATRWFFSVLYNDGICICSKVNLAKNIGIGSNNATHYKKGDKDPYNKLKIGKIKWPLKIAQSIQLDKQQLKYDKKDFFRIRMIGLKKKLRIL